MLTLIDKVTTPPGGFFYVVPQTRIEIKSISWNDIVSKVKTHYVANNIHIPDELEALIEDHMCKAMPPGVCAQSEGVTTHRRNFSIADVKSGTMTILSWVASGFSRVPPAEAQRRTSICASCPYNRKFDGCIPCKLPDLMETVNRITGGQRTSGDEHLNACQFCGCSLKAKVWVPLETIQGNANPETNKELPDWCWWKKAQ